MAEHYIQMNKLINTHWLLLLKLDKEKRKTPMNCDL